MIALCNRQISYAIDNDPTGKNISKCIIAYDKYFVYARLYWAKLDEILVLVEIRMIAIIKVP